MQENFPESSAESIVFEVLKNPTARVIIKMIKKNPSLIESEIAKNLNVDANAVRHHLRRLQLAKIVSKRKEALPTGRSSYRLTIDSQIIRKAFHSLLNALEGKIET